MIALPLLALVTVGATGGATVDLDELLRPREDLAGELLRQGIELRQAGKEREALLVLDKAAKSEAIGDLEDYARVHGAQAAMALGEATEAARLLRGMTGGTALDDRAGGLLGRALAATGKIDAAADAVRLLKSYLQRFPRGGQAGAVRRVLAESLERSGDAAGAKAERRRLWVTHPRVASGADIDTLDDPPPTPDEIMDRAQSYYRVHKHDDVLELVDPLLTRKAVKGLTKAQVCRARFMSGHTRTKKRKHADAADELTRHVRAGCRDQRVRALYLLGRARDRSGRDAQAVEAFDLLVQEFPGASYADDALLLKAIVLLELKRDRQAIKTLKEQVRRYPDGDMAHEAWWRLAWIPWTKGRITQSLKALKAALATGKREKSWYTRGRTQYWKGRALWRLGKRTKAKATWREAIADYPLAYYAFQSANRLRDAKSLPRADLLPKPTGAARRSYKHRAAFDGPSFKRAVRLLRLGLGGEARRELSAAGLLDDGAGDGKWLAADLFERVGDFPRSHNIPRRSIPAFQDRMPTGEALHEWRLAYPRPFDKEMARASKENKLPTDFLMGLVREESGFDPNVESWANAVGLGQLLRKTARSMARKLPGPPVALDEKSLREPALNLRLGGRYLGMLQKMFGHPALMAAGYNAGEGAVGKWRKRFKGLSADEFVESIPYEQTRNYTKRVVESWGRYRFLYGKGEVIRLPQKVPQ